MNTDYSLNELKSVQRAQRADITALQLGFDFQVQRDYRNRCAPTAAVVRMT